MIERKQIITYVAKCDGKCGWIIDWDREHADGFTKKKELIQVLKEDGWQRRGKRWYCPECSKLKE